MGPIVGLLAAGRSRDEILKAYPCDELEDMKARPGVCGVAGRRARGGAGRRMSIPIVVDAEPVARLDSTVAATGWSAIHWSSVGDHAHDRPECLGMGGGQSSMSCSRTIWALGLALALTHATGPSVLQVRGRDVLPDHMGPLILAALNQHEADLAAGALVVVDESRSRVRVLPL